MQDSERKFKDWQNPQFMLWICQIYPKVNTYKSSVPRKLRYRLIPPPKNPHMTGMKHARADQCGCPATVARFCGETSEHQRRSQPLHPINAGIRLPLHTIAYRRRNTNPRVPQNWPRVPDQCGCPATVARFRGETSEHHCRPQPTGTPKLTPGRINSAGCGRQLTWKHGGALKPANKDGVRWRRPATNMAI